MSLTFTDLIALWNTASGSDESSDGLSVTVGINQALSYFSSMHPWKGMVRSAVPLATVAGQDYLVLPVDCEEIISIQYNVARGWQAVEYTDMANLERLRTAGEFATPYTGTYWAADSWKETPTGPVLVLNTYPPLNPTAADTFRLSYRATLTMTGSGTDADTQQVQVPPYLESLVFRLVTAFAKAREEEDDGPLEARLSFLDSSAFVTNLKRRDGRTRPVYGPMRNGASQRRSSLVRYDDDVLGDPA